MPSVEPKPLPFIVIIVFVPAVVFVLEKDVITGAAELDLLAVKLFLLLSRIDS